MRKKLLSVAAAILVASVLIVGCGATGEPQIADTVGEGGYPGVPEAAEGVEVEKEVVAMQPTAAPEALAQASGDLHLTTAGTARTDRMIIKNAELDLLVADTDVAMDSVTVIAADYGGYIVSSHTWFEDEFKFATFRLGVPVIEFENVLRRLRGLALKVNSEVATGEDVTDQFVDLQSQLTNLQATRDRIREFMEKAETVEEALKVNEQLSQVEGQIEEIQGRMNYLQDRSAYSTIDVQLNPERPTPTPTPTPTPAAWRPGKTFNQASNVLLSLLKGLADAAIWLLVVLGPFFIPLALLIWLVIWLRRRKARQAASGRRPEPPAPASPAGEGD